MIEQVGCDSPWNWAPLRPRFGPESWWERDRPRVLVQAASLSWPPTATWKKCQRSSWQCEIKQNLYNTLPAIVSTSLHREWPKSPKVSSSHSKLTGSMSRWHQTTCAIPNVFVDGDTPRCRTCNSIPPLEELIAQQRHLDGLSTLPPDEEIGRSVGNNIKYKCTDCTDCSPSFLTQTDYGPY